MIHENMKKAAAHHESWEQLWETKWKPLATMGVYPFMFGAAKDFEPILELMKKVWIRRGHVGERSLMSRAAKPQGALRLEHIPRQLLPQG